MTASRPGRLLTLEGLEGVGKTTNLAFVESWLQRHEIPYLVTREPGGTPLAEELRHLLLNPRTEAVDPWCELLMVFAARAQHLNTLIRPALAAGTWVLSDRFTDATYAYQGAGRGLPLPDIEVLENLVQRELRPDCTFLLDAPPEVGLSRARDRGELDRFEREKIDFFERARRIYLDRAAAAPERYHVLDATQPLAAVQQDMAARLEALRP